MDENKKPMESKLTSSPPPPDSDSDSDPDAGLEQVVAQKRRALIKAWEENEKTKADNNAYTKISAIGVWEDTKRATIEAQIKQNQKDTEDEKEKQRQKMKQKIETLHKKAEEKRAAAEAKKKEDILKTQKAAENFRATGTLPNTFLECFGY